MIQDQSELAQLKRSLVKLLDEFDRICTKHNLSYFLDSGTALGAVRHKGFIPWDDDIDVGMLRSDYEKFLEVAQNEVSDEFFLQTKKTEPNFYKFSAKLRLRGTYYPEKLRLPLKENGIFIDIFPFDYIPNRPWLAKLFVSYSRLLLKLVSYWYMDYSELDRFYKKVFFRLARLQSKTIREYTYEKFCRKYECHLTQNITCLFYGMTQRQTYVFPIERMFPTRQITFESKQYQIMNDVDYYLNLMYGDYMKLPPIEKRFYHRSGNIIFKM